MTFSTTALRPFTTFPLFLLFIALFSDCNNTSVNADGSPKKQRILPPSSGTHSELLVVMPDELWEGKTGEIFREYYLADQEGLPQSEPYFDVTRVEPNEANGLLKKSKSIFWVQLSDTSFTRMEKDLWARPQRIVRITAPTDLAAAKSVKASAHNFIQEFRLHDMANIQNRLKKSAYAYTHENLKDLGIKDMLLHKGFDPTLDKPHLKMFRTQTLKTLQYVIVSSRPMTDGLVSVEDVIAHRDSIGKNYFEGSYDDSYMTTEMLIPPAIAPTEIGGMYALETRGLWRMEGDFMGGPFLSYSIYDEKNNQILTVESLLYGPQAKKRNVVLEMEAMMRSIRF